MKSIFTMFYTIFLPLILNTLLSNSLLISSNDLDSAGCLPDPDNNNKSSLLDNIDNDQTTEIYRRNAEACKETPSLPGSSNVAPQSTQTKPAEDPCEHKESGRNDHVTCGGFEFLQEGDWDVSFVTHCVGGKHFLQ